MRVKWIPLFIIVLFMGACSEKITVEEVFERGIEAHDEIHSMVLETTGQTDSIDISWIAELNMSEGIYSLQYDNQLDIYKDQDSFIGALDGEALDEYSVGFLLEKVISEYEYVLKRFDQYVGDVNEAFELEVEEDHYMITYVGDEEQQQLLADQLANETITQILGDEVAIVDSQIEQLEFVFTIDKETNLVTTFEQEVRIIINLEENEWLLTDHFVFDEYLTTTFSQFDSVGEIEKPVVSETTFVEIDETLEEVDLSDEEIDEFQQQAADYVDAFIKATVFQDAEGFGEQVAGTQTVEEKQDEGEFQRDSFVEFYRQNTTMNMGGLVSDELIDELTEAYMHALSQTSYEVIDSQMVSNDQFVVTLSITGLHDSTLLQDIENQIIEEMEQGIEKVDNWAEYQVELMIEAYNGDFVEGETTEATATVYRDGYGSYHVLMQDEYLLGGFVQ